MGLLINVFSKPEVQLCTLQINSKHSLVAISKMPNSAYTTRINSAASLHRILTVDIKLPIRIGIKDYQTLIRMLLLTRL